MSPTFVNIHVHPLVLSQANHSTLAAVYTSANKLRYLNGVWVLQAGIGKPILRNAVDGAGKNDICLYVSYHGI